MLYDGRQKFHLRQEAGSAEESSGIRGVWRRGINIFM